MDSEGTVFVREPIGRVSQCDVIQQVLQKAVDLQFAKKSERGESPKKKGSIVKDLVSHPVTIACGDGGKRIAIASAYRVLVATLDPAHEPSTQKRPPPPQETILEHPDQDAAQEEPAAEEEEEEEGSEEGGFDDFGDAEVGEMPPLSPSGAHVESAGPEIPEELSAAASPAAAAAVGSPPAFEPCDRTWDETDAVTALRWLPASPDGVENQHFICVGFQSGFLRFFGGPGATTYLLSVHFHTLPVRGIRVRPDSETGTV